MKLAVVTATLDYPRAQDCITGWWTSAWHPISTYIVGQGGFAAGWTNSGKGYATALGNCFLYGSPEILGVVPAFAIGVQKALEDGAEIIACLHDDLLIEQSGWDQVVRDVFQKESQVGLVGFGGGTGLADENIYQVPYNPMQLARKDFVSNMRDAEAHGRRVTHPMRVACLDGFSQIGRREFWQGYAHTKSLGHVCPTCGATGFAPSAQTHRCAFCDGQENSDTDTNLFTLMQEWGVIHHFYDGMLGCFAKRLGWEVWMLPIACHHLGGQTAVGDARYHQWASDRRPTGLIDTPQPGGDQIFWLEAHQIGYDHFRDVLPIRLPEER